MTISVILMFAMLNLAPQQLAVDEDAASGCCALAHHKDAPLLYSSIQYVNKRDVYYLIALIITCAYIKTLSTAPQTATRAERPGHNQA